MQIYHTPEEQPRLPFDHPNVVRMGQWTTSPDTMHTSNVSGCVALVAHNAETRLGLVGHFAAISPANVVPREYRDWQPLPRENTHADVFNTAVEAIPTLGRSTETTVWMGGAALWHSEDDWLEAWGEEAILDRVWAEQRVGQLGVRVGIPQSAIVAEWNNSGGHLAAHLHPPTGVLTVAEQFVRPQPLDQE